MLDAICLVRVSCQPLFPRYTGGTLKSLGPVFRNLPPLPFASEMGGFIYFLCLRRHSIVLRVVLHLKATAWRKFSQKSCFLKTRILPAVVDITKHTLLLTEDEMMIDETCLSRK